MKTDNRGMTLVEAIVAGMLMVFGTLILSTGFLAATRMMTISAAERKTADSVTATMNGGSRGSTSDTGIRKNISFSVDGFRVELKNVEMHEYCDRNNENIRFYRIQQHN